MKERRRWSDVPNDTGFDKARRIAMALWPFLASLAAVALLLAATVVSVRAIRDRERLEELAVAVGNIAAQAKQVSEGNRWLLEREGVCNPGDPPDTPPCQRAARTAKAVDEAVNRIAGAIAAHDANSSAQHDDLRRALRVRRPPPPRQSIISELRPPAPSTAPPPPTTTTTACHPKGRCK